MRTKLLADLTTKEFETIADQRDLILNSLEYLKRESFQFHLNNHFLWILQPTRIKLINIYNIAVYYLGGKTMSDPNEWNASIIAEFRKNHGKVGGYFEGAPLLLLHHTGARSGKARLNPIMYLKNGDRYLVFASKGGADTNPDWYYNIKAHPDVQIELGDETIDARADEITGPERDTLYERQASIYPTFAQYQLKTKRMIPVIALIPKSLGR